MDMDNVIVNGVYTPEGVVDKNELWAKYGFLVRLEALRLQARLPRNVELDDLIQAGAIGFLSAIDNYKPKKGVGLSSWITQKIRWALIDELRERDWVPRSVRRNARDISSTILRIEQESGRAATEAEVAIAMGISLCEYQQMLADTNSSQIYSLDELREEMAEDIEPFDAHHESLDPLHSLMLNNMVKKISREISALPEREQAVLSFYYQHELNMKEVGALLGITETRVSQLHSHAIKRLRARMDLTISG